MYMYDIKLFAKNEPFEDLDVSTRKIFGTIRKVAEGRT